MNGFTEIDETPSATAYVFAILFGIIGLFFIPYVMTILWDWFVVPLGVPAIGMAHAFGLSVLYGLFKMRAPENIKKDPETSKTLVAKQLAIGVLAPALALLFGYIAHLLMN